MKFKMIFLALTLFTGVLTGQTTLDEAFVQFEITDIQSDDPQTSGMIQSMKGGTVDIYFKGNKQRVDVDMMGGMIKMSTLNGEGGDKPNVLFMDMMGQKLKIAMDDEEFGQYQNQSGADEIKPKVEKVPGQGKSILGYACEKVIISYEGNSNMQGMKLVAYVTDEISAPHNVIQNGPSNDLNLEGFPLEYSIDHPQMSMTYEVVKLEKKVSSDVFTEPAGYREMDFSQFIQTMGAFSGGMGQ